MPAASLTKRFLLTLLLSATVPLVAFGWFALAGMRERVEGRIGDVYLPQLASDTAVTLAARLALIPKSLALLVAAPGQAASQTPERPGKFQKNRPRLLAPNLNKGISNLESLAGSQTRKRGEILFGKASTLNNPWAPLYSKTK